jgi:predicted nucleic acid-binding Zn ribbon protein
MSKPEERFSHRVTFCVVCGNSMPRYQRICDRCGSIQRPVQGDGEAIPPDEIGACDRCGKEIPGGQEFCDECFLVLNPAEQAALRKLALAKVARVTTASLAASGVLAMIAASTLTGAAFIVVMIVGAGLLVVFGGLYGIIYYRDKKRSMLDPPIILKPILPQSKTDEAGKRGDKVKI